MVGSDQIVGPSGGQWNACLIYQLAQQFGSTRQAYAGAAQQEWTVRLFEPFDDSQTGRFQSIILANSCTALLQMGWAMATVGPSWSPSCRRLGRS